MDRLTRLSPLRLESASVSAQENKRNLLLTIDVPAAIVKLESISGEILLNQEKVEVDINSYYDFRGTNQTTFHCTLSVAPEAVDVYKRQVYPWSLYHSGKIPCGNVTRFL